MGAGKLPEQINERLGEALRDADHKPHPIIEKLKAQPVNRDIKPEEDNQRRVMSVGAAKGTRTIAKNLALGRQLKALYHKIDTLRSSDPLMASGKKAVAEQIASLRQHARSLRKKIDGFRSRKQARKRKR